MPSFIRHFLLYFLRYSAAHRLLIAVVLYSFTWFSGAAVMYAIGVEYDTGDVIHARWGFLDCLYMAAITLTTVGYEVVVDIESLTMEGQDVFKMFLTVYTLTAYIVALYATGSIISVFIEGTLLRYLKRWRMDKEIEELDGHYIVCGCGTTGIHVVHELRRLGLRVLAIDDDPEHLQHALDHDPDVVVLEGDAMDDDVLAKAKVESAAGLFAVLPEDRDNILLTVSARQMNAKLRIVSRATIFENEEKFRRVGASAVISPNHIGGLRMASEMVRPAVVDFLDTMLARSDESIRFEHVAIRSEGPADGKLLGDLHIYRETDLSVIGIMRKDATVEYNPGGTTKVHAGDSVIVIANRERLARLGKLLNG